MKKGKGDKYKIFVCSVDKLIEWQERSKQTDKKTNATKNRRRKLSSFKKKHVKMYTDGQFTRFDYQSAPRVMCAKTIHQCQTQN